MVNQPKLETERGSAVVAFALAGAFVVVATLLLSGLAQRASSRSRAQAAADAAALAGVVDGRNGAAALAAANDAVLVRFEDRGNEVTVEVVNDDGAAASASAERRLAAFDRG